MFQVDSKYTDLSVFQTLAVLFSYFSQINSEWQKNSSSSLFV